jgi:hypothetical protein
LAVRKLWKNFSMTTPFSSVTPFRIIKLEIIRGAEARKK